MYCLELLLWRAWSAVKIRLLLVLMINLYTQMNGFAVSLHGEAALVKGSDE